MGDADLAAEIMEALDAEARHESAPGHVALRAHPVGRRHLVIEYHHDLLGVREREHLAPHMGHEIGVEQHRGIDLDYGDVARRHFCAAAGAGEDFLDDGAPHQIGLPPMSVLVLSMTACGVATSSCMRWVSSSPVSGTTSSFMRAASLRNAGSRTALSSARRNASSRSAGTPGGAAEGKPNSMVEL